MGYVRLSILCRFREDFIEEKTSELSPEEEIGSS